ncbi:MAG TPA: tetratricopeptide repeat protein [Smithellaceae bacterium]|nr:tetratricopeptide repeat protein [Smithellaceae bacterium]
MLTKENGFELPFHWTLPEASKYTFTFIALFVFLIVIYSNSFQGQFVFDDTPNIIENSNIHLQSLNWPDIKQTFYGILGEKISRPFSYFTLALNYHFGGLNVFGYHLVNFIIHYLAAIFLFLFIFNTLKLPALRERYGQAAYGIALLATVFWATSPLQVTAVTYIVQRMASMAGLFYILSMFFYLKGRTADKPWRSILYWGLCIVSALLSFGSKENAVLLPISIWLYDLLLIQGVTRKNLIKNVKILAPLVFVFAVIGFWYVDIEHYLSGDAYAHRPFTLAERLLTEPRIIVFYITLLLYPVSSRLTLIHDIQVSTSLFSPGSTLPAIFLILFFLVVAVYLSRKRPFLSFCILFFFLNHAIEGSFLALELIYEHRNYIPSMFFFAPLVIFILFVIDYFSYKKVIQFTVVTVVTFLLVAQGHTVFMRNRLFTNPVLLWSDNLEKTPGLSRTYNNLGAAYWDLGYYDEAYNLYSKALFLNSYSNLSNRGVNLHNLGMYYLNVKKDYDKALNFYEAAIKAYPGYVYSYNDAAICLIRKGNFAEAGRRLISALSKWPNNAQLRHSLGFVLLKAGQSDEAIKQSRRALFCDPELFNAFSVIAQAYYAKGNYMQSIFNWRKYIVKNPNDLEANLALMDLYAKTKNSEALCRTIGKLMMLNGSINWQDFVDKLNKDKTSLVYEPDLKKLMAIVRNNSCL